MNHRTLAVVLLVLSPFAIALAEPPPAPATQPVATTQPDVDPFAGFVKNWRTDPRWGLRQREVARYTVTARNTKATDEWIDTSEEQADPRSKNRALNPFRENTRKVVQQLSYTAGGPNFVQQTLVFIGAEDFKSLRIDATILDIYGTTYKQFINHKGTLEWHQFSNEPDEGHKTGSYAPPKKLAYENALPVLLRGYPFEGDHKPIEIALLPDQSTGVLTPAQPVPAVIQFVKTETVELAKVADPKAWPEIASTHHLRVVPNGDESQALHFWFAENKDHVLVKSECRGVKRLIKSVEFIEK